MKGYVFTPEEKALLSKHKHIAKVTDHTVQFTPEFKKLAVTENVDKGRRPQDIFITEEVPVAIIGSRTPERNLGAWRKMTKKRGIDALEEDSRRHNKTKGHGRKKKEPIDENNMTDAEKIEYYKARSAYLDAENDFLARTRELQRMAPFEYHPGTSTHS